MAAEQTPGSTSGVAATPSSGHQPRLGAPFFDVRIERGGAQRIFRAEPPGLVRLDFDPPASGPEAELTFGTAPGAEPVDEDFLRAEVERIGGCPVLAIRTRNHPAQVQRRVLILEAPDDDEPIGNVFGQDVVQGSLSLIADADEVFVFRGDEASCTKHRDSSSLAYDPVAVAIQRQPHVEELAPDLTLVHRGKTLGAHMGLPLAYAEALRDSVKVEHGTDEQKKLAATALAEITDFCAAEGGGS